MKAVSVKLGCNYVDVLTDCRGNHYGRQHVRKAILYLSSTSIWTLRIQSKSGRKID